MRDPYEVLGVPRGSSSERIDEAYRQKSREYGSDPAKMEELNSAYDAVVMGLGGGSYTYAGSNLDDIRAKINSGRLDDAQVLLDGIPFAQRTAEWYYLRGVIYDRKGWLDRAAESFARASQMEPGNSEYRAACDSVTRARNGGYRTSGTRRQSGDSHKGCCGGDWLDMCLALVCIDSCCECSGHDCISCI